MGTANAERLLTVTSTAEGLLKQYVYDTAATHGLGKVHQAIRHNRLDVPGDGTGSDVDVVVTETYDYGGIDGRVSSVLTTNTFNDLDFLLTQTYEPLGRLEDLTYPVCLGSPECPVDELTVRNTYAQDYLVQVGTPCTPDGGVVVTYHPNGLWSTLTRSLSDGTVLGVITATTVGVGMDLAATAVDVFTMGASTGEAIGSGASGTEIASAVAGDVLRASALAVPLALAGRSAAAGVGCREGTRWRDQIRNAP